MIIVGIEGGGKGSVSLYFNSPKEDVRIILSTTIITTNTITLISSSSTPGAGRSIGHVACVSKAVITIMHAKVTWHNCLE